VDLEHLLTQCDVEIVKMNEVEPSLEDVFLALLGT
jgi:hypothetical protein